MPSRQKGSPSPGLPDVDPIDSDQDELVTYEETRSADKKGRKTVSINIPLFPGGIAAGAYRSIKIVDEHGEPVPITRVEIPSYLPTKITDPIPPPKKATKYEKRSYAEQLKQVESENKIVEIALAIDQMDVDDEQKVDLIFKSTKLARATKLVQIALNAEGNTAFRALERISDHERGGKMGSQKPSESGDDLQGVVFEEI